MAPLHSLLAPLVLFATPAACYIAGPVGGRPSGEYYSRAVAQLGTSGAEQAPEQGVAAEPSAFGLALAGACAGVVLGWLRSSRQQAASAAGAAAVVLAPMAAPAIIDYDAIKYLGGSDKVDLNNANVQAYRQFPGMYPTAAGAIATHGPYKQVSDIYNIPGLDEKVKAIMKKYENNFVTLPANEAYFIDRVNNGMYR